MNIIKATAAGGKPGKGILTLNISTNSNVPQSSEGYVLEIKDGQVIINVRAQAGLFYGCQTLLQLPEDVRDHRVIIPACRITDYRHINYRAVHLDVKHHVDAIGYYYKILTNVFFNW